MNGNQDNDRNSAETLIDALRQEIKELEGIDDHVVPDLPAEVLTLLNRSDAQPRVAAALDLLIATDDPISDDLAARIRAGTKSIQAEQGVSLRFLEQLVAHAREAQSLSVADIAAQVEESDEIVANIERGRAAFNTLRRDQVASWIQYLSLNVDAALDALRHSLTSPATGYGGDTYPSDEADHFVRDVEAILRGDAELTPSG